MMTRIRPDHSMKPAMKNTCLTLLAVFLTAAFITGCSTTMFSDSVLYPERQPIVKNPADYGMQYEEFTFKSLDGVDLAAWLIPGTGDRLAIITHPGGFTRYGYSAEHQANIVKLTEVDVEFLKTARVLNDAGYSVLMFDFRNHGQSGTSPNGGVTGVGLHEWRDVAAAVQFAQNDPRLEDKNIALVSFCQGANASIIAMAKAKKELEPVQCLIAVQPIGVDVFSKALLTDKFTRVGASFIPVVEARCIERGGQAYAEMSPLPYAKKISAPVLYVQALSDPWTELSFIEQMAEDSPEPKEVFWVRGDLARFDTYNYFADHPEKMLEFLDRHMQP